MNIQVRHATEEELCEVSALEQGCFGDESLHAEGLKNWWKVYGHGAYVMLVDQSVSGALGIWPVRHRTFARLRAGSITEREIRPDDIVSTAELESGPNVNWYLASVILAPDLRHRQLSRVLTHRAFRLWVMSGHLADTLNLCALAFTTEGTRCLKHLGFDPIGTSAGQYAVFVQETSLKAVRERLVRTVAEQVPLIPGYHLQAYLRNRGPVGRKWDAIHGVTALVQLFVAAGLAEMSRIPGDLQNQIRPWIRTPSARQWVHVGRALVQKMEADSKLAGLRPYLRELLSFAGDLLDDRNAWAHYVSMTSSIAEHLLQAQQPEIETGFAGLDWMKDLNLVGCIDGEVKTIGGGTNDLGQCADWARACGLADTGEAQRADLVCTIGRAALINEHRSLLELWPLFLCSKARDPKVIQPVLQIYSGTDRETGEPVYSPLGISEIQGLRLPEARPALQMMFGLNRQVAGFEEEIQRDASEHIGRIKELSLVEHVVRDESSCGRILWLWGAPGIGKSFLMSFVSFRLIDEPPPKTLSLFYRFRQGDFRNSREDFLTYISERMAEWDGVNPLAGKGAECDFAALERLRSALARIRQGYRLIVMLDGLDEILTRDPDLARDVPFSLTMPRVTWVLASRHEQALQHLLREGIDKNLFPTGLPPMDDGDIRFMLFRNLEGRARDLMQLDSVSRKARFTLPSTDRVSFDKRAPAAEAISAFRKHGFELSPWTRVFRLARDLWIVLDSGNGCAFEVEGKGQCLHVSEILIENAFTQRVTQHAQGLPIYVRYLVNEINEAGAAYEFAADALPAGMEAFYDKLLATILAYGDNIAIRTFLVCVLAVVKEPLTTTQLKDLCKWCGFLEASDDAAAAQTVEHLLRLCQNVISWRPTPDGSAGMTLYHHSLREHILKRLPHDTRGAIRHITRVCEDVRQIPESLKPYVLRQGVVHLIESEKLASAVHLHSKILRRRVSSRTGRLPRIEPARLLSLAKMLCVSFGGFLNAGRPGDPLAQLAEKRQVQLQQEAERTDPEELIELMAMLYEITPLYYGISLIYRYHRTCWRRLLGQLLAKEDMIVRYTVGEVLANAYDETGDEMIYAEALKLSRNSADIDLREVGQYAMKFIYMRRPEKIDPLFVEQMATGGSFYDRGIIGELLLHVAFMGVDVMALVDPKQNSLFWDPVWDYNRVEVGDIQAAVAFCSGRRPDAEGFQPGSPPESSEILPPYELLMTNWRRRQTLLEVISADESPLVRTLVSRFFELTRDAIPTAEIELSRCRQLKDVAQLLLSHPAWDVREAMATSLASIAMTREEAVSFIAGLLCDDDWKVRYGAVEAAWSYRTADGGQLFSSTVKTHWNDTNCRVRGLLAENLVAWIINTRGEREKKRMVTAWKDYLRRFLEDGDIWPTENLYLLLRHLHQIGTEKKPAWRPIWEYLLAGSPPLLAARQGWWRVGRNEFLLMLEHERRKQIRRIPN